MLVDQTAAEANAQKICLQRKARQAEEEIKLYRTEIIDKIKRTLLDNLLTDTFTPAEECRPDIWYADVTVDPELYGKVKSKIVKHLNWMGWKAEIDDTDYMFDQYTVIVTPDENIKSRPEKRKELRDIGWDYNKMEISRVQESQRKAADKQLRRISSRIEKAMCKHPRKHQWTVDPEELLSRRVLKAVKAAFAKQGCTIEESFEKEKGKEKEKVNDSQGKLTLTISESA